MFIPNIYKNKMVFFFQIKYTMGDADSMSMARSYYAQALKLNNKNVRALYGFFLVCSFILQLYDFEYL